MKPSAYLSELNKQLSLLYAFARQINELDFAASLSGEFRGAQDAGWATTITAHQVFDELQIHLQEQRQRSRSELRIILMLYCQLAEAGGVYETLKNLLGVITNKPYLLWPFQSLVRVKQQPKRIIGPNANAMFRNLATTAREIGLTRLSELLEHTFRDDIRNGISHADYTIWDDGLRLRKRNGGYAQPIPFDELADAITRGVGFFQLLRDNASAVELFDPPKTITGRFSMNPPMPWTVAYDRAIGSFSISSSSPGSVSTPEFERQMAINGLLGGRVAAVYLRDTEDAETILKLFLADGIEPHIVPMADGKFEALRKDATVADLWDIRIADNRNSTALLLTPSGFVGFHTEISLAKLLPPTTVEFEFVDKPSPAPNS